MIDTKLNTLRYLTTELLKYADYRLLYHLSFDHVNEEEAKKALNKVEQLVVELKELLGAD